MIESIRSTIRERSSEWRSLANVPTETDQIESTIASARRSDGDAASTLRDADHVSARKQSFALQLRDFESFERNLPPDEWVDQRREFFRVTCEQMLSLPSFFELATYLPRLIALAASCHDSPALSMIFTTLFRLPGEIRETCHITVAAYASDGLVARDVNDQVATLVLNNWTRQLVNQATESLASGWRDRISAIDLRPILIPLHPYIDDLARPLPSVAILQSQHRRMAQRDLAHRPYRWSLLDLPNADKVIPVQRSAVPLDPTLEGGLTLLVDELRRRRGRKRRDLEVPGSANSGLAFATRPPTPMELSIALPSSDSRQYGVVDSRVISQILKAMRGYFGDQAATVRLRSGLPTEIQIPTNQSKRQVRVALTMLQADDENAMAAAGGNPNLSLARMRHIRTVLNSVAMHADRPDYLLLPELAMPARWFPEFARALMRSGISLIAGIEHQPRGKRSVTNQVWAALRIDGFGLPFFVYKQDKQRPAVLEKWLLAKAGKSLVPSQKWRMPPVIVHGEFRFAFLICSELTNISYRAHLRGAVDALFVPEWNKDVHSFEALVESSALDLHSYIAQANTRGFGDTRLRAPMKQLWDRDVVRLKGGSHDYFVVGEINYDTLRTFQSSDGFVPEGSPEIFKPLPDGFRMDPRRA